MFKFRKKATQAKRKTPASQSSSFRWKKSYNWIFLLVPIAIGGYGLSRMDQVLPIRTIQLSGTFEYLDQGEVEKTLQEYIGQGFFSFDIHQLQKVLHENSWTESVSVRRVWPDKIRVMITEKKPVARWDEHHLLSNRAKVYQADAGAFAHLPLVHAASHRPQWVLSQFYVLDARFTSVDERVLALRVDSRGALDVELINGLQIKLGRGDIERKIDRLISIYAQQILPRREQIQRLDLRYSNGFAVAWKEEVLQGQDKASIWSNSNV
ncbi:MAG: FtsQ-type POTRA domain-containing protein [Gammaproteobacteria bacterium]|nr:MAG: FtsQ-type POTRA domain-containing protein [Gammaproteobacteria bacterium]